MTDGTATAPPPKARDDKVERAKRTVAAIARLIEDRDEIVDDALERLERSGVIDRSTREKTWDKYARGDARTRRYIGDLVARIVGGERRTGPLDPEEVRGSPSSREALESLKEVSHREGPRHPEDHDDRERDGKGDDENALLRMLAAFPVQVLRFQRGLIFAGVVILSLVGVAAVFPGHARLVLFYGFLVLLGILGLFLIKWAFQMDRALKRQGIDVKNLSRLEPAERRILLVRRFLRKRFSSERIGAFVERRMRNGRAARRRHKKVAAANKDA